MTGPDVLREIEQFLYREARLADERLFDEWLQMFTDDLRYWMPARMSRYARNSHALVIADPQRYEEEDLTKDGQFALLDETKATLAMRVARLKTGFAWAEEPASRTRRFVSNIEVEEAGAEPTVYSNFILYRNRLETEQDFFVGRRIDTVRRVDGAWKISRRKIVLDQNVLLAKNLLGLF
jgi:3-phenylpropionate/cinnamic acid dioxygenase small subunit